MISKNKKGHFLVTMQIIEHFLLVEKLIQNRFERETTLRTNTFNVSTVMFHRKHDFHEIINTITKLL